MFLKADKSQRNNSVIDQVRNPAGRGSVPSIISADLRITGDLECSGDIQIDGVVNGDIQSRNIVIGEGASVTGSLKAETVQVFGKLIGQIHADTVTLERTAHVAGDILHKALAIAQGAFLEGAIKRVDAPKLAAAAAPAGDAAVTPAADNGDGENGKADGAKAEQAKADEAKTEAEEAAA
jgi:cytoskeletal protein CcmA (bactofilin family)